MYRMVDRARVKIYAVKGGRHSINLASSFVTDSAFPFQINEELIARIDGNRIVIEKLRKNEVRRYG